MVTRRPFGARLYDLQEIDRNVLGEERLDVCCGTHVRILLLKAAPPRALVLGINVDCAWHAVAYKLPRGSKRLPLSGGIGGRRKEAKVLLGIVRFPPANYKAVKIAKIVHWVRLDVEK